jgi:hypothetical protein
MSSSLFSKEQVNISSVDEPVGRDAEPGHELLRRGAAVVRTLSGTQGDFQFDELPQAFNAVEMYARRADKKDPAPLADHAPRAASGRRHLLQPGGIRRALHKVAGLFRPACPAAR